MLNTCSVCYRGPPLPDQAEASAGDTLGSDEPAVDYGGDAPESDRAVVEVKLAAKKASCFLLKRHDMGDSAESRLV